LPIQEAAKDVTISTTLDDLEETIAMAITNLDHYISDRDAAINNIEMEEENIKVPHNVWSCDLQNQSNFLL
jgi:hypothetical protein